MDVCSRRSEGVGWVGREWKALVKSEGSAP